MDSLKEKDSKVETSDSDFGSLSLFQSKPFLSDITLISPTSLQQIPYFYHFFIKEYSSHRVILASGSEYFFDYFKSLPDKQISEFKVPIPVETFTKITEDPLTPILSYLYHNQVRFS